jgi:hypothetical protein
MTFIVKTRSDRFEIRESHATPDGPRSRTLASFAELTDDVAEKARKRASTPVSTDQLRAAALRAGAPVPGPKVDEAARKTLRLLARGDNPDPMLRRLLLDSLQGEGPGDRPRRPGALVSDNARAALEWIGAGAGERAKALRDLLDLADALPIRPRPHEIDFPRLRSA